MELETINFHDASNRIYSDIRKVDGKYLYLSGLISEDLETGEILDGDIKFQTNCVLNNLKTILEKYDSDMAHIIRMEVILQDFADREEMNNEYVKHFKQEHLPARLCFGNAALADNMKIEIMATAIVKDKEN